MHKCVIGSGSARQIVLRQLPEAACNGRIAGQISQLLAFGGARPKHCGCRHAKPFALLPRKDG
jgi:hypothetical protein